MKFSTKSRYAIMAIVDMAINADDAPVTLQRISSGQNIPLNYLEQIFSKLRRGGIVSSIKGPGGGYVLSYPVEELLLSSVILAVDGGMKMTMCSQGKKCSASGGKCATHGIWKGLGKTLLDYFNTISVADVVKEYKENRLTL